MPVASDSTELYRDRQSSVSPSWLINGKSRYAVRTLIKLEFHKISRPKVRAFVMLLLGGVLTLVSVRYILIGAQPSFIPIIMLAGSLTLIAGSACALYFARSSFRIDMTLLDGSCVSMHRKRKVDAEALLAGLSTAMDWHRSADLELQPLSQTSRLKKGLARSTGKQQVAPTDLHTRKSAARKNEVSPVVTMEHIRMKARIAPLLGLLSRLRNRGSAD